MRMKMMVGLTVLFLVLCVAPANADKLLGIDGGGEIWSIDTDSCFASSLVDTDPGDDGLSLGSAGPNSLAYDQDNRRIYFATLLDGCTDSSDLYFYDVDADTTFPAGTIGSCPADATFDDGFYYYIGQTSSDLRRTSFNPDGTVDVDSSVGDLSADDTVFAFGDIAARSEEDVQNSVETRGSPELVVYAAWAWAGGGVDSLPSWSSNFGKCR